jgi:hypothetical protein
MSGPVRNTKLIQNLQTSQGYIFRVLQHLATKLCNFSNFGMLFNAVIMNCIISNFCLLSNANLKSEYSQ